MSEHTHPLTLHSNAMGPLWPMRLTSQHTEQRHPIKRAVCDDTCRASQREEDERQDMYQAIISPDNQAEVEQKPQAILTILPAINALWSCLLSTEYKNDMWWCQAGVARCLAPRPVWRADVNG